MATKKTKGQKGQVDDLQSLQNEAALLEQQYEEQRREALSRPLPFGMIDREPESELPKRLLQARESKRLTQGQLADLTKAADKDGKGLSRGVISLYELGTNRPGPREIRLLCEVLRVTPSFLIYGEDDPFSGLDEMERYGGRTRSEPEFYAYLTYCFSRLHKHHRVAMMDLMLGLLRGWNKGFDQELRNEASDKFLKLASDLKEVLSKREPKG